MPAELSRADAARAMGAKVTEVVEVRPHEDGGFVVRTHDGADSLVASDQPGAPLAFVRLLSTTASRAQEAVEDAQAEAEALEGGEPPADEVPAGTVAEVLAWVGDDRDRSALALEVERAKDKPRTGLVAELDRRLAV